MLASGAARRNAELANQAVIRLVNRLVKMNYSEIVLRDCLRDRVIHFLPKLTTLHLAYNPLSLSLHIILLWFKQDTMRNRSQEENFRLLLDAFRLAGSRGLSIDQAKELLFGKDATAGSRTKKLLDRLKTKGVIRTQMGLAGIVYVINAGQ